MCSKFYLDYPDIDRSLRHNISPTDRLLTPVYPPNCVSWRYNNEKVQQFGLVLTIFNEGAYLTYKSIFHKADYGLTFDCDITLESVPGTNQY